MTDLNASDNIDEKKSCHFFTFEEADRFIFKKRDIRKKFNCDENKEAIKEQSESINNAYLKLAVSYAKNDIFGIIRHGNVFYDASLISINYIHSMLKEHYREMPSESYNVLSKFATSISIFTNHLFKAKDDWAQSFANKNDPDFDQLIEQGEKKLTELIANLDKIEQLESMLYNNQLSVTRAECKRNNLV